MFIFAGRKFCSSMYYFVYFYFLNVLFFSLLLLLFEMQKRYHLFIYPPTLIPKKSNEVNYLPSILYLSFLPHTNVNIFQSCLFIYFLFIFSAGPVSAKVQLKRKRKDILAADNPDVRTRVCACMCV